MRNKFEFMGNTLLGQYIPRKSWLHQRDPRARLIVFLLFFLSVIFTSDLLGLGLGFLSVILIYLAARLPFKPAWQSILRAFPFVLILALLQIIFMQKTVHSTVLHTIFGLAITKNALESAGLLVLRFFVLIALLNSVVMSISTSQITTALFYLLKPFEKIGFPVNDLIMIIQITLRYIPLVAQIAEKTAKAQAARGGDWEQRGFNPIRQAKMILPLFIPIFVISLRRAETMAIAMESRGFNAAKQRSSYYELSFTYQDSILLFLSLVVSILMILSSAVY
jgi:energy-coupling factor transport system permease protein